MSFVQKAVDRLGKAACLSPLSTLAGSLVVMSTYFIHNLGTDIAQNFGFYTQPRMLVYMGWGSDFYPLSTLPMNTNIYKNNY